MIGILDSGLGGLAVARDLESLLPGAAITYLGDTAFFPYGNRSTGRIANRVQQGIGFLADQGAALIVLACATGSAAWLSRGQKSGLPVVDAVTAVVDRVLALPRCSRIGVVGTPAFITTGIFENLVKERAPNTRVYPCAAPLLVPLIEDGRLNRPELRMVVKKYLHPLKVRKIDALVMGCNHYAQISRLMRCKIPKRISLVDCVDAVSRNAASHLRQHVPPAARPGIDGSRTYFLTDLTDNMAAIGNRMFGRGLTFRLCDL